MEPRVERDTKHMSPSKRLTEYIIEDFPEVFMGFVAGIIYATILAGAVYLWGQKNPLMFIAFPTAVILVVLRVTRRFTETLINTGTVTLIAWSFIAGIKIGALTLFFAGIANIVMLLVDFALPKPPSSE